MDRRGRGRCLLPSSPYFDSCVDCLNVVRSQTSNVFAVKDRCGKCDTDYRNDCRADRCGVWGGGGKSLDVCGECGGGNTSCVDCNGKPFGAATTDKCGKCAPSHRARCTLDCAGKWGGVARRDLCGHCQGDNSTCTDCNGKVGGSAISDQCGKCVSSAGGMCKQDCRGAWGGSARRDRCGVCGGKNRCVDCNNVTRRNGGTGRLDRCGTCLTKQQRRKGQRCKADCGGAWGGGSVLDECKVCGGDNSTCAQVVASSKLTLTGANASAYFFGSAACNKLIEAIAKKFKVPAKRVKIKRCQDQTRRRQLRAGNDSLSLDFTVALNKSTNVSESFKNSSLSGYNASTSKPKVVKYDCNGTVNGSMKLDRCDVCGGKNACVDCANITSGQSNTDKCGKCDTNTSDDCAEDCKSVWGGSTKEDRRPPGRPTHGERGGVGGVTKM